MIDHADSVVLVLIPGSGDSIQALKAGVMEIPDIIVVNKSDHPLADTMVREIRGVLSLAPQEGWRVPIIKTEAARGEGVETLAEKLAEHRAHVEAEGTLSERRRRNLMNEVLGIATMRLRRALEASLREDPEVQELLDEVVARRLDPASAASAVLARGAIDPGEAAAPTRRAVPGDHSSSSRCNTTAAPYSRVMRWTMVAFACAVVLAALRCPCPRGAAERAARGGRRRPPRDRQRRRHRPADAVDAASPRVRSPGSPGRRTATGSRSRTPGRSSASTSPPGAARRSPTAGATPNPGWSADGRRIGFLRGGGADSSRVPADGRRRERAAVLGPARRDGARLGAEPRELRASSVPPLLLLAERAADLDRRASARRRGRRTASGSRSPTPPGCARSTTGLVPVVGDGSRARRPDSPRWSPDGRSLALSRRRRAADARALTAASPRTVLGARRHRRRLAAVHGRRDRRAASRSARRTARRRR